MYDPAAPPQVSPAYSALPGRLPGLYELRPLTTGEVLDRTFSLYRGNFWLFCGLSAVAAALATVTGLVQLVWASSITRGTASATAGKAPTPEALRSILIASVLTLLVAFLYFMAYSIIQAATVSAVTSVYLGHTTSIKQALGVGLKRWYRYICIAFWQIWSGIWLFTVLLMPATFLVAVPSLRSIGFLLFFLAFASLIYGVIAYIRNSLAIAASVTEDLPIRRSMRRSKNLIAGHKFRIFLLLLLLFALRLLAGGLQIPFALFLTHSPAGQKIAAQGLSLALGFVTNSLIGPVGAIGFCLFYIDERVRKEGFDIEALMDPSLGSRPSGGTGPDLPFTLPAGFNAQPGTMASAPPPPASPASSASLSASAPFEPLLPDSLPPDPLAPEPERN